MNEIEEFYKFFKMHWIFCSEYGIMYVAAADCAFSRLFVRAYFAETCIITLIKLYMEGIPMSKKYCYLFSEGNAKMRELLGGKGANLAEMTNLGLPVPQGFTISTEACTQYYEDGRQINPEIMAEIMEYIVKME